MGKKKLVVFFIYSLLALFATRNLVLAPGTIGHNWDWLIPPRVEYLKELFSSSFFTWQSSNLGESRIFQLPALPFTIFLTFPSFLGLGGDFISKFLIIITIVLAGIGMFVLLENILSKQNQGILFPSFLAGFFYAFSPFLFADFIGGAATQFFAYALFPWLLFFVRSLNQEKTNFWLYLLLATLTLSLITISLQVLALSSLTLFAYFLIQGKKLIYFKNLLFLYFSYLFLNLYWIIPTGGEYLNLAKTVFSSTFFDPTNIKFRVPSLWEIFLATGYWRPLFLYSIQPSILNFWLGVSYLVVIFILAANLFLKKSKESLFWLFVLLLSFIFATGGKEPMGDQVLWLYLKFPLMALFRSPQHLLVVPIFAFAVLLGLGVALSKINQRKFLRLFLLALVVFWLHPFFLYGDIGAKYLSEKKKDYLDVFQLSPGYQKTFDFLQAERWKENFRILFLPMSSSPRYLKTDYQNRGQGGDPLVIYSPYGTLVSDINYNPNSKELAELLEQKIYEREDPRLIDKILRVLNIQYILVRKDVIPEFSTNKEIWSPERTSQYLTSNPNLQKIYDFGDLEVFQNLGFQPGSFFSLSENPIYVNNNAATLWNSLALNSFNPQKEILISGYVSPSVLLELSSSKPSDPTTHRNLFDFSSPVGGNYELLIKKEDYLENLMADPLNPLVFNWDGFLMQRESSKEENGWFSYGELNLSAGEHNLEIVIPETLSLLYDASFEEGTWVKKPEASLTLDSKNGYKALSLIAKNNPTSVFQEIKNIKPGATYAISFLAKTIEGEPPHISVFQDTDVVREGTVIPKVNHYMGRNSSYNFFATKLRTNLETKKAFLHLYADPPENQGKTVVLYDDVKVQRLFTSSVFLRQKEQKTLEESFLPKINFRRLNPTKYLVEIQEARYPYFLTFSESFSPQWKVFPLEEKENVELASSLKNWFRQSMPESNHYLANYYANTWLIDKKGNYRLIIEHRPQRLFYLGTIFSLLFLLFLLGNVTRSLVFRSPKTKG